MPPDALAERRREVARLFLRLGFTAFGGPAAHVAMMRQEVVERRGWLPEEAFIDVVGLTSLLPGPNSTELAIHIGRHRAGRAGLLIAGACFIGPAVAIVLVLAVLYRRYGTTVAGERLLYGIEPVVIVVVVQAVLGLGRRVARRRALIVVIAAAFAAALVGVNEIALLLGAAIVTAVARRRRRTGPHRLTMLAPLWIARASTTSTDTNVSLWRLFGIFLKVGALLFGSGYVLVAFLRHDLVHGTGWLTNEQLLDAVAVGQFTPGPLFSTATFVGYQVAGFSGATVATAGIFGPSFVLVALVGPFLPRLRGSPWAGAALDGVNAAAVGLMAAVALQLLRTALVDPLTIAIAVAALAVLLRWRLNSAWLIVGGALVGLLRLL